MDTATDNDTRPLEARYTHYHTLIANQHPALDSFSVDEVAREMDEIDGDLDAESLAQRLAVLQYQGYTLDVAVEMAWREHMVTVYAPPGCLLARLTVAGKREKQIRLTFTLE